MIEINDTILYGTEGVCTVVDIVQRDFGGKSIPYYVLQPVYNNRSTIYVPVHNEALTAKMRRVLSKEEIYQIIQAMPSETSIWIEDEPERKETYKQILQQGDRIELVRMIKALHQHQLDQRAKGKHLHTADEHFFKEAEKLLYDEFALVLDIQPDEVLSFIMQQLDEDESSDKAKDNEAASMAR